VTPCLVSVIILCSIQAYVKFGVLYEFCEMHPVLATLSFKIITQSNISHSRFAKGLFGKWLEEKIWQLKSRQ
jgi:hypothetical protein